MEAMIEIVEHYGEWLPLNTMGIRIAESLGKPTLTTEQVREYYRRGWIIKSKNNEWIENVWGIGYRLNDETIGR